MPSTARLTQRAGQGAARLARRQRLLAAATFLAVLAAPLAASCATGALTPPAIPEAAISGGQVMLEVAIGQGGHVGDVTVLKETPPFVEPTVAAVKSWSLDGSDRHVLVAASFRAPELVGSSMAPADTLATPTNAIPYPVSAPMPEYPANALGSGVAIVAVNVDAQGQVAGARLEEGAGAFADVALSTARLWTFRPASQEGTPVASEAYLIFAFREPIIMPAGKSTTGH